MVMSVSPLSSRIARPKISINFHDSMSILGFLDNGNLLMVMDMLLSWDWLVHKCPLMSITW
jgi:hypothetical protein